MLKLIITYFSRFLIELIVCFYSIGCGGAVTGNSGNISSPTNALQYPHSVRCIWTITAADKTRSVQLQFTLFDLEVDSRCRYDYVMFRDGAFLTSPVLYNSTAARGRFCGTRKPPIVTSSSESLTLIFITDISIAKVGFSARWITVPQTTGKYNSVLCNFELIKLYYKISVSLEMNNVLLKSPKMLKTFYGMRWT